GRAIVRAQHPFPPRRSSDLSPVPIELGAEFIHGTSPEVWDAVRAARLLVCETSDRFWRSRDGVLWPMPHFRARLMEVIRRIGPRDRKSTRLNSSHVKISYAV